MPTPPSTHRGPVSVEIDAKPLSSTTLNLPNRRAGKVRDVYDLPPTRPGEPARLLIVATDRISAFDVVMPTPIAGKGRLLTQLSTFWFHFIQKHQLAPTHWLSDDARELPESGLNIPREALAGRITIAKRARVVPIECVVRGYLEGSGWKEYQQSGSVCGIQLPAGLKQCDRLPEPIFTPATKAPQGQHDENISFDQAAAAVGSKQMNYLRDRSLAIYKKAAEHALARGIIIADTKFEFGVPLDGPETAAPIIIDEALTPDSSRFWPVDGYTPGRAQKSFDKQYLREYLEELVAKGQWNKQAPGPSLPEPIMQATLQRYREAYDRLVSP